MVDPDHLQAMRRALPGYGNELVYPIKCDTHQTPAVDDVWPMEIPYNPMG